MVNNCYYLYKENSYEKAIINKTLDGFDITPKNSNRYGVSVDKLIVMNKNFINVILKRRIKRKLELYLRFIIEFIDDGDDDGDSINQILNDIKRYKQILNYKYNKYLDQKYTDALLKKLEIIEKEFNVKLYLINEKQSIYEEEKKGHRRR